MVSIHLKFGPPFVGVHIYIVTTSPSTEDELIGSGPSSFLSIDHQNRIVGHYGTDAGLALNEEVCMHDIVSSLWRSSPPDRNLVAVAAANRQSDTQTAGAFRHSRRLWAFVACTVTYLSHRALYIDLSRCLSALESLYNTIFVLEGDVHGGELLAYAMCLLSALHRLLSLEAERL